MFGLVFFVLRLWPGLAYGLTFPLIRRDIVPPIPSPSEIQSTTDDDPFGFVNIANIAYTVLMYVSGEPFVVHLDTGSSDLWFDTAGPSVSDTLDTGIVGNITYGDRSFAAGKITLADISLGPFSVPNQAWVDAPGSNADYHGLFQGVLGLGPPSSSVVSRQLRSANSSYNGTTFLQNIFSLWPDQATFFTFGLSRTINVSDFADGGVFTIGETSKKFPQVTSSPKLPLFSDSGWLTSIDAVVINGRRVSNATVTKQVQRQMSCFRRLTCSRFHSSCFRRLTCSRFHSSTLQNPWVALLDTGSTSMLAPRAFVDEVFGGLPGAQWEEITKRYLVPCDAKMNFSVIFGNHEYPMHPIDIITPVTDSSGSFTGHCGIGIFAGEETPLSVSYFILGDVFLRNAYSLFDFGSFASSGKNPPYIQLLSVTSADEAWADYDALNAARLKQIAASNKPSSHGALMNNKMSPMDMMISNLQRNTVIIMVLFGVVFVLLVTLISIILRSRRKEAEKQRETEMEAMSSLAYPETRKPLQVLLPRSDDGSSSSTAAYYSTLSSTKRGSHSA
ncbi:acid protease [Panus rudis PR-1116 ss-1]|nr:acid protease [Panus rudis PR-1116 ss-1]